MPVTSNWTVTWDPASPLALLAVGQEMEGELEMPWEQEHEDRKVIEGDHTEPLPRSWVKGSLTFTAWKEHASDAAARDYLRTHRAVIHALRGLRKTLRITPTGGTNDDKPNTMIKSARGRMLIDPENVARTAFTYTFLGPW